MLGVSAELALVRHWWLLALADYFDVFCFLVPLVRGGFCPWKSFLLISKSQAVVFTDRSSLRSRSFHAGKWASAFQMATTVSALLTMGECCHLQNGHVCFNVVTGH